MSITKSRVRPSSVVSEPVSPTLLHQYGCGPIQFTEADHRLYDRHLLFDNVMALDSGGPGEVANGNVPSLQARQRVRFASLTAASSLFSRLPITRPPADLP
jgi:hypothetical protein